MHAEAPMPRLDVDGMAAHALMHMHTDCSEDWDRLVQRPATALADSRVIAMTKPSGRHCVPTDAHELLPMRLGPTCTLHMKPEESTWVSLIRLKKCALRQRSCAEGLAVLCRTGRRP